MPNKLEVLKVEVRELESEQPNSLGFCEFLIMPACGDFIEILKSMFPTYQYQILKIVHMPVHETFRELQVGKFQEPKVVMYVGNRTLVDV